MGGHERDTTAEDFLDSLAYEPSIERLPTGITKDYVSALILTGGAECRG